MKEIICEFPSHDLAEQATHAIRQQGFSISEEQFEAKEHQTKTSCSNGRSADDLFFPACTGRICFFAVKKH